MAMLIILLGRTGHGKSATGNTFLGMEIFRTNDTPISYTGCTERCSTIYNGINMSAIDTPGIFETNHNHTNDVTDDFKYQCQIVENLMNSLSRSEINAFFFVYNITSRYTAEERQAIEILKQLFGPRAITHFGALIFTYGDTFNRNFEDWQRQQGGSLRELIDEFNGRVILISNKSENQEMRTESRRRMIDLVQSMRRNGSYTNRDYELLKTDREFFIFTESVPEIKRKYQRKIDDLTNTINGSSTLKKEEANHHTERINHLQRKIRLKSLGTNRLDVEQQQLEHLKLIVSAKSASCALL